MPAPQGNKNAKRLHTGIQVNYYLGVSDTEEIRHILQERGEDASDAAVRRFAREASKNGVALELVGKCKVEGCWYAGEVECAVHSENGFCPGRFCLYHYGQIHLPEDERDEVDLIVGRPLFKLFKKIAHGHEREAVRDLWLRATIRDKEQSQ
jgi:hypothetical protein